MHLISCQEDSKSGQDKGKLIVCTTGMIADLAKNIVQDSIEVHSLMGPGVDPHLYKATQGDLALLQKADLIVYNGLHLEGKMTEILEGMKAHRNVIAISDLVDSSRILSDPQFPENPDPHLWFNVELWASSLPGLADNICMIDNSRCSLFKENAMAYKTKLDKLHQKVYKKIQSIPDEKRILITAHDAFKYFGEAYDIEVRGLQGISTLSEFGLRDRIELVDFIVENKIPAVFVESSVPRKNIEAIVDACQKKGHNVRIGPSLYSDAMGDEESKAATYTGMVTHNVMNIAAALKFEGDFRI